MVCSFAQLPETVKPLSAAKPSVSINILHKQDHQIVHWNLPRSNPSPTPRLYIFLPFCLSVLIHI